MMKRAAAVYILFSAGVLGGLRAGFRSDARAAEPERALFGSYPTRNMVSDETGLPTKWDVKTGMNVKWSQASGSQTYAGPVVADGKVFIGTNNEAMRNPKLKGDKGVVMAFRASDGQFLWQMVTPKLGAGKVSDWEFLGMCSTPTIVGDKGYVIADGSRGFIFNGDPQCIVDFFEIGTRPKLVADR